MDEVLALIPVEEYAMDASAAFDDLPIVRVQVFPADADGNPDGNVLRQAHRTPETDHRSGLLISGDKQQ